MIVNYRLSVDAGYKANIATIGMTNYDPLAIQYKENFPDVKLTRPNTHTEMLDLHTKCLLTVNGYIHDTVFDNGNLYIPNATKSMLKLRQNHIGIMAFDRLSSPLVKTHLTDGMISSEANIPICEKVLITFDRDIGNCILVLAGYMIFEDPEVFYRISDRTFALRLDRINHIEKIYELSRHRDILPELGINPPDVNPLLLDANLVKGEHAVRKFMTLNNSFLVEVPGTITTKKIYAEHSNIPGTMRTEVGQDLPLITGYGKLSEYKKTKNIENKYTISTVDAYRDNFLFSKMQQDRVELYNNNRIPGRTYDLARAFFLEITIA